MEKRPRCLRCHKRTVCNLFRPMELTLPWVANALKEEGTKNAIHRALRGCGSSPGYTEDWIRDGAMTREDVEELVEIIYRKGNVNMSILCSFCHQFIGPK